MAVLSDKLRGISAQLSELNKKHSALPPAGIIDEDADNKLIQQLQLSLSDDTITVLNQLRDAVDEDIHRYHPPIKTEEEIIAEELAELNAEEPVSLEPEQPIHTLSSYAENFAQQLRFPSPWANKVDLVNQADNQLMPVPEQNLHALMEAELEYLSNQREELNISIITLQKLKKASHAFAIGRPKDALTLLRSAQRDDKHNKSLCFLVSQLLYWRAHNNGPESLPQAREEAQRACAYEEKTDKTSLIRHRYYTITAERMFSAQRTIEMMRDYYLLSPESLTGDEGFNSHEGIHLKSWLVLATIPPSYWSKFETESLAEVAQRTVGGGLFYLHFFSKQVTPLIKENVDMFGRFAEVEFNLKKSFNNYQEVYHGCLRHVSEHGGLLNPAPMPWVLRTRYLQIFLTASPVPKFDEILMNASIDGRRYEGDTYPTYIVKESGLQHTIYWHTWVAAITPRDEERLISRIPYKEVEEEREFIPSFQSMLETLTAEEEKRIDHEHWADIKDLMANQAVEYLIEVGKNVHDDPSLIRGPRDPYFRAYYHDWSRNNAQYKKMSDAIRENAIRGGFKDPRDAFYAFEGANRLLDDPTYGVKARCKAAYLRFKTGKVAASPDAQHNANNTAPNQAMRSHMQDFWWLYFLVMPMGIVTFFSVATAGDYEEALKLLGVIVVLLLLVGMVLAKLFSTNNKN